MGALDTAVGDFAYVSHNTYFRPSDSMGKATGFQHYDVGMEATYDLQKLPKDETVQGDVWLLELSYEQIGDYHAGITFTPQQRVAFAVEIFDVVELHELEAGNQRLEQFAILFLAGRRQGAERPAMERLIER